MALGELICFTVLAPVFDFTAPTMETGLVLVVLMIVSFQVMRTVLKIFEQTEAAVKRFREKRLEQKHGSLDSST